MNYLNPGQKANNDLSSSKSDAGSSEKQNYSQSSLKGSFDSMSSIDLGLTASKKCYICSKNFNFRKKHFCKFCQNAVCSDHSAKVREKEGMREGQRICDLCDQEEEKTVIKGLIDHEVSSLGEELKMAKDTNDRLYKEHFEKTATVNQLEEDLSKLEDSYTKEIQNTHLELENLKTQKQEAQDVLEKLRERLRASKKNEVLFQSKTKTYNGLIEDLQEKFQGAKGKTEKAESEVRRIEKFMDENFGTEKIGKSLCLKCNGKVNESLQKVHLRPVWEPSEGKVD